VTRQKLRRTARAANQNATCRQFPTLAPIARLPCLALPCPALAFPSHRNSTPLHSKSKARHGTARYTACPSIKAAGATVVLPPLPPLPPRLHAMAATAAAASQTFAWLTVQWDRKERRRGEERREQICNGTSQLLMMLMMLMPVVTGVPFASEERRGEGEGGEWGRIGPGHRPRSCEGRRGPG
jgi:hypothetical protein